VVMTMERDVQFVAMVMTSAIGVNMLMGFGGAAAAGSTHYSTSSSRTRNSSPAVTVRPKPPQAEQGS
jgi:hypothetical protein